MSTEDVKKPATPPDPAPETTDSATAARNLPPAALRALAEAEARRKAAADRALPPEIGGRGGADPARFGDWEIDGRAIDF